jgi:tetratricopeptide (TPR) repeat protein/DNA-binding CsgD family transcriptional regulator
MCNKGLYFAFFFIISVFCARRLVAAQATQARVDSLLAVLPEAKEDTNKVLLLCEISVAYFQLAPDKGITYGRHALKLATRLKYERGIMKANNAIGRCHAVQTDLSLALKHFNDALAMARKLDSKDDIARLLLSIGNVFSEKGEHEKALNYHLKAKDAYEQAGVKNRHRVMNSIGSTFVRMEQFSKAVPCLKEAIAMEENDKADPGALATSFLNIGAAYIGLGRYDSSLHYLQKALENTEITGNKKSTANTLCNISTIYIDLGRGKFPTLPDSLQNKTQNFERSVAYAKQALAITNELGLQSLRCSVLFNISLGYRELGNYKVALDYFDQYYFLNDTLIRMDRERAFAKAEAEFNVRKTTDSLTYQNILKDKELKKRRSDRNKLIAIISLIGASGLLLINRQKLKHVQKRKEAEAQKLHAEELAGQQLLEFTKRIQEKNELIDVVSAEIAKLKESRSGANMSLDETMLSELRQSILLTDQQWDSFKANFEKVHTGYLSRLRTKLPDLTPAETRFIVLSKLKMSPREMGGMLGITPPAVRANKYRLMKKLGFEDDHKLDELIQNI